MSIGSRFKKIFFPTEEMEVSKAKNEPVNFVPLPPVAQAVPPETITRLEKDIHQGQIVATPIQYSDVQKIADSLIKSGQIIININCMVSNEEATRLIDFLAGVVYVYKGDIMKGEQGTFHFRINPE